MVPRIAIWGATIALFGVVPYLSAALVFLAIAGAAEFVISAVFRGTIVQLEAPDELRGRINSIQLAVVQGGPRLGNLEAGAVAQAVSNQFSVISGGLGSLVGIALIARAMPRLLSYEITPVKPRSRSPASRCSDEVRRLGRQARTAAEFRCGARPTGQVLRAGLRLDAIGARPEDRGGRP